MLAMCTSSGPSASRSILAQLNICASSVSCDRPFAPWTWKNHEYLMSYSFEIHALLSNKFLPNSQTFVEVYPSAGQ